MLQEYNQKQEDSKKCESVAPIDRWNWWMTLEKFFHLLQIPSLFKS